MFKFKNNGPRLIELNFFEEKEDPGDGQHFHRVCFYENSIWKSWKLKSVSETTPYNNSINSMFIINYTILDKFRLLRYVRYNPEWKILPKYFDFPGCG